MWSPYLELTSVIDIGHLVDGCKKDERFRRWCACWLLGCYTAYPLDTILERALSAPIGVRRSQANGCRLGSAELAIWEHQFINMYLCERKTHCWSCSFAWNLLRRLASHCASDLYQVRSTDSVQLWCCSRCNGWDLESRRKCLSIVHREATTGVTSEDASSHAIICFYRGFFFGTLCGQAESQSLSAQTASRRL